MLIRNGNFISIALAFDIVDNSIQFIKVPSEKKKEEINHGISKPKCVFCLAQLVARERSLRGLGRMQ